jgi:hypothetical protein
MIVPRYSRCDRHKTSWHQFGCLAAKAWAKDVSNCDGAATTRFCSRKIATFLSKPALAVDFMSKNTGFGSILAEK